MSSSSGPWAPKYSRIADDLRREIREGSYRPGDRLPAETSIADHHHVSVPTVRQAIAILRTEGILESRHGVGTFVKTERRLQRRSRHRYGRARTDKRLLTAHLHHEILSAGREPAPSHIADAMGVSTPTEVVVRRRLLRDPETRRVEELGASYLPLDVAAGTFLEEHQVVPKALFLCVEDLTGKRYAHARDHWTARTADPTEAELLEVAPGTQLIHVVHTAHADDTTVLEVSESLWPADRIVIVDEYPIAPDAEQPAAPSEV